MARASLNPKRMREGGGGIEAGNYEVIGAKAQNLKSDFKTNPVLTLVFDLAVLDKDGDRVRGADDVVLRLGFGDKALESYRPGKANGRDGDVDDLGDAIDVEGNTIFCDDGAELNKSSAASVFLCSLDKIGFPGEVLDACYLPDFVGMKFAIKTATPQEANKELGLRLNERPMAGQEAPTSWCKIVTKWLNQTYLKGDSKKVNGKAADEPTLAAAPSDPKEIAVAVLGRVAKVKPGEKNKIKSAQQLKGFFTAEYTKAKNPSYPPKLLSETQKLLADNDFMAEALATIGAFEDEGTYTFPDAE